MIWHGRHVDVLSLWGEFVDLPANIEEPMPTYLDLVRCPNPEHQTHKKHFQVNTKKPFVHCFARCGISGTYEHAISMITGCDEREARRTILRHTRAALRGEASAYAGLGTRKTVTEEDEVAKDERALRGGQYRWLPAKARDYLAGRGVDGTSIGKWELGWDEDAERIVIPAYDDRGIFRFLIRNRIDGIQSAKYLYTLGAVKTSLLFGACRLDREQVESRGLVLNEGPYDPVRLHQLGFPIAAAILGTGISTRQVRLIDKIGPKRVYLMFDKDLAGVANIEACKARIHKVPLYVCLYPRHRSDPAEMTREEVEHSLDTALPINAFYRKTRSVRNRGKVTT